MIAIVEPKIGIALTNHFTKAKWEKASKAYLAYQATHPNKEEQGKGGQAHKGNAPMANAVLGGAVFKEVLPVAQPVTPSPFVLPVQVSPVPTLTLPLPIPSSPSRPRTVLEPSPWVVKTLPEIRQQQSLTPTLASGNQKIPL
jgi:hypothetical protein